MRRGGWGERIPSSEARVSPRVHAKCLCVSKGLGGEGRGGGRRGDGPESDEEKTPTPAPRNTRRQRTPNRPNIRSPPIKPHPLPTRHLPRHTPRHKQRTPNHSRSHRSKAITQHLPSTPIPSPLIVRIMALFEGAFGGGVEASCQGAEEVEGEEEEGECVEGEGEEGEAD